MKQKYVIALAVLAIAINLYVGLTHVMLNPAQMRIVNAKDAQQADYIVSNNSFHFPLHFKNQRSTNE